MTRTAIALFGALLLTACSSVQLAYRNADILLASQAEDWLDLDDSQLERWQPLLDDMLVRHRARELPALVALLAALEGGAAQGFSEAGMRCLGKHVRQRWQATATLLAEVSAPLLVDLRPAQVAHLREQMRIRGVEYREEHLGADPVERDAARVTRVLRRIERWTGRLDREQRSLVTRHVDGWPRLAQGWFDYRSRRQTQLLALIESGADVAQVQRFLVDWWVLQVDMPQALMAARVRVETGVRRLTIELLATLGREQTEHLLGEIGELRGSLAGLLSPHEVTTAIAAMRCDPGAGTTES